MPNHMHGILIFLDDFDLSQRTPRWDVPTQRRHPLGNVMNSYKGAVTFAARQHHIPPETKLWQPRYHDHIIRNTPEYDHIRAYVLDNPARWQTDTFNAP